MLPKNRDSRFITIRPGGKLTDTEHHLLDMWVAAFAMCTPSAPVGRSNNK